MFQYKLKANIPLVLSAIKQGGHNLIQLVSARSTAMDGLTCKTLQVPMKDHISGEMSVKNPVIEEGAEYISSPFQVGSEFKGKSSIQLPELVQSLTCT